MPVQAEVVRQINFNSCEGRWDPDSCQSFWYGGSSTKYRVTAIGITEIRFYCLVKNVKWGSLRRILGPGSEYQWSQYYPKSTSKIPRKRGICRKLSKRLATHTRTAMRRRDFQNADVIPQIGITDMTSNRGTVSHLSVTGKKRGSREKVTTPAYGAAG